MLLLAPLLLLMAAGAGAAPAAPGAVVAYMPGGTPAVDAQILAGLRAVLDERGVRVVLGGTATQWSNAAPETVRLVYEHGARVLVSPPERRVAHLMAQVATKTRTPVISTSAEPTVGATGSTWVYVVTAEGAPGYAFALGQAAAKAALQHLDP